VAEESVSAAAVVVEELASAAETAAVEEPASSQAVDSDWAWRLVVMVSRAWVAALAADLHRADSLAEDNIQACDLAPRADDWPVVLPGWADDNSVGDSASSRHIPGDCYKGPVAGDTRHAADDKDFSIRPKPCDCSSTGAMPNSIPIPSIPTGGCSQTESQAESAVRNSQPQRW
jgi:hypothetical protein